VGNITEERERDNLLAPEKAEKIVQSTLISERQFMK
jgi:hypothetical protein